MIAEAARRAGIEAKQIDEAILGNVLQAGLGQNPARQAALKGGCDPRVAALTINKVCGSGLKAVMLAAQAIRAGDAELDAWAASGKPLLVLVPEFDDYLRPAEARARFARVPQAEVITGERAKHLWVGEPAVRTVLGEIVRRVNPAAWPLPTEWEDLR